jgi:hypothetical protein
LAFSGLEDLLVVIAIFGAGGYGLYRVVRKIFAEESPSPPRSGQV